MVHDKLLLADQFKFTANLLLEIELPPNNFQKKQILRKH